MQLRLKRWFADARLRAAAWQFATAAAIISGVLWLAGNTLDNLQRSGIAVGLDFLGRAARFPISESLLAYSPSDTFGWALTVGLVNTLFVTLLVCIGATALGLLVGLARRSHHPLAYALATAFVETLRNTPLVVQLLFWYALLTVGLPHPDAALAPVAGTYLSDRGLYFPAIQVDGDASLFYATTAAGIIAALAIGRYARRRRAAAAAIAIAAAAIAAGAAWMHGGLSLRLEYPQLQRFNFIGGLALTPEFAALTLGLVLYSASFIGEIIRGGIDAVAPGQWEAGRALALSEAQTLRLIIAPQALRVIIPPMTSQYINIVKNTTLALVVGYPDIAFVTATTINQTGQAIEGILILMAIFLIISLAASLFLNSYNRRLARTQQR